MQPLAPRKQLKRQLQQHSAYLLNNLKRLDRESFNNENDGAEIPEAESKMKDLFVVESLPMLITLLNLLKLVTEML